MEKDEDNIYNYEVEDPDDSPFNYASGITEDEEEIEENSEKGTNPFLLMVDVMFSPVHGWKKIRREGTAPEKWQTGCFYPLLALLALSKFAEFFYSPKVTLSIVITTAVIAFVSYFFGYFSVLIFLKMLFSKSSGANFEGKYGQVYIMCAMSTLVLFSIFTSLLPMLWPVLIFLPLWTIYIMYRGIRFFKLTEKIVLKFTVLTCGATIGFPLIIDWLLTTILPN